MNARANTPGGWWDSPILERLVNGRRRRALAILLERSASVGEQELASRLVATERETPLTDVSREEAEKARIELRHSHLPALHDADLVVWNRATATVTTTDHPALHDPRLRYVVDQRGEEWEELMSNLVVERRRIALSVLVAHDEPISKPALAHEIAIREGDADPSVDGVEETLISLHHAHLPKLRAAGLVEYDEDEETVAYSGHPELEGAWFDVASDEPTSTNRQRPTQ